MRILALTPFLPDPEGTHGGAVYLGTYLAELGRRCEVALASLVSPEEGETPSALRETMAHIERVPHPQLRDLYGSDVLVHKLRMLRYWGWVGLPLLAAKHHSPAYARRVLALHDEFRPDVVMVEQAVMAQYLALFEHTPTVMADHERGEALPGAIGPMGLGRSWDARLWRRYVAQHYSRASLVQALNAEDASHLSGLLGRRVEVRPLVVPTPPQVIAPEKAAPRALFLGNYLHLPNVEAAKHLAAEVWPQVRAQREDAELWLAGANADPAVSHLASQPGVRIVGEVADLDDVFRESRMLLAPLYSGGGVRVKVLTAMAHGLPVVSNRLGLRGLHPPPLEVGGETAAELAKAVLTYLEHPDEAGSAGRAARAWIEAHVSANALAERQSDRFEKLLRNGHG